MQFTLADDFDIETFNNVVHDGRYDFSDVEYRADKRQLVVLLAKESCRLASGADPALLIPKPGDFENFIDHIKVVFEGVVDYAMKDEAQIEVGDIANVSLSNGNVIVAGGIPVTLTITMASPFVVTVQRV